MSIKKTYEIVASCWLIYLNHMMMRGLANLKGNKTCLERLEDNMVRQRIHKQNALVIVYAVIPEDENQMQNITV
jgi:hypothetical protein